MSSSPSEAGLDGVPAFEELFRRVVRAHADALAVASGTRSLSYGQLDEESAVLARAVMALGCPHDQPVAVLT